MDPPPFEDPWPPIEDPVPAWEAVHGAIIQNNLQRLEALIHQGAPVGVADSVCAGHTPLTRAIQARHPEILQALLAAGADPSAPGFRGDTPLRLACELGWVDGVAALQEAGALPYPQGFPVMWFLRAQLSIRGRLSNLWLDVLWEHYLKLHGAVELERRVLLVGVNRGTAASVVYLLNKCLLAYLQRPQTRPVAHKLKACNGCFHLLGQGHMCHNRDMLPYMLRRGTFMRYAKKPTLDPLVFDCQCCEIPFIYKLIKKRDNMAAVLAMLVYNVEPWTNLIQCHSRTFSMIDFCIQKLLQGESVMEDVLHTLLLAGIPVGMIQKRFSMYPECDKIKRAQLMHLYCQPLTLRQACVVAVRRLCAGVDHIFCLRLSGLLESITETSPSVYSSENMTLHLMESKTGISIPLQVLPNVDDVTGTAVLPPGRVNINQYVPHFEQEKKSSPFSREAQFNHSHSQDIIGELLSGEQALPGLQKYADFVLARRSLYDQKELRRDCDHCPALPMVIRDLLSLSHLRHDHPHLYQVSTL